MSLNSKISSDNNSLLGYMMKQLQTINIISLEELIGKCNTRISENHRQFLYQKKANKTKLIAEALQKIGDQRKSELCKLILMPQHWLYSNEN